MHTWRTYVRTWVHESGR